MLCVYCLEVKAQAVTPLRYDEHSGSALRGAFVEALMEKFCMNRAAPSCSVCPLAPGCPVASLVAPVHDEQMKVPGCGEELPRPFTVLSPRPSLLLHEANTLSQQEHQQQAKSEDEHPHVYQQEKELGTHYEPGETFSFGLTLLGTTSTRLFPFIFGAFQSMEDKGFGRRIQELYGKRGRFHITEVRVYHPFKKNEQQILWQQGMAQPKRPLLGITSEDIRLRAQQISSQQITIHFLSPTRLQAEREPLKRPTFHVLALRLAARLEQLQILYGETPTSTTTPEPQREKGRGDTPVSPKDGGKEWYLQIGTQADAVSVLHDHTYWNRVISYSSRQQKTLPLDGFMGHVTFVGDIGPQLRELLAWGEVIRVGKSATKGNGYFRVATPPQERTEEDRSNDCTASTV